uniref:Uncharacterized protein n=1 Tax=Chrysemys picta bellii TaxID=8478 RepID=A0A8C3FM93_CHRPI
MHIECIYNSAAILCFYYQGVVTCLFKVQGLLYCNFPGFWVQTQFLTGFFWNVAEDVADLRARRCIFPQADFVDSLRLSPIHSREDQVKAALAFPIQGFLQH